jgi:hypothetical protein
MELKYNFNSENGEANEHYRLYDREFMTLAIVCLKSAVFMECRPSQLLGRVHANVQGTPHQSRLGR